MTGQPSFDRVTARCTWTLAVAAGVFAAAAVVSLLHAMGRAPWAAELTRGALVGGAGTLLLTAFLALAMWSFRSHELAVERGMIPRWSATWAAYAWFAPLVNLVVPFAILRQRFAAYHLDARRPLLWLQALFAGSVLLWAWILARIVPESAERWTALAAAATALCFWRLRGIVAVLSARQRATADAAAADGSISP